MTNPVMKVVSREGRIELELIGGTPADQQELIAMISHSKELLVELDTVEGEVVSVRSKLTAEQLAEYRKEGEGWLQVAASSMGFWDNEIDDETWNNA